MPSRLEIITQNLQQVLGGKLTSLSEQLGELIATVKLDELPAVATTLRDRAELNFETLIDLCGVDYSDYAGDWDGARRIHARWLPLFLGNFRGAPNPVPAKAAMMLMGLLDGDAVRAPLLPLEPDARAALAVTLRSLGLVEARGGRVVEARREAVA